MALLPERLDHSIRSSNKENEYYDPYDALFEQYVESDLFEPRDFLNGTNSSDDSTKFFDLATSSGASDNVGSSPIPDLDARHDDAYASWQRCLQLLQKSSVSPTFETSTGADKAAALNPDILSIDGFCAAPAPSPLSGASVSPPPSPLAAISATKKRFALPIRPYTGSKSPVRKCQRMSTPSPNMLSPRLQRTSYQGAWAKKIEAAADKFSLQLALTDDPLSPPPTSSLPQLPRQDFHGLPNVQGFDSAPLISPLSGPLSPMSTFNSQSHAQFTPLASPTFSSPNANRKSFPQTQLASVAPTSLSKAGYGLHTPPPSSKIPSTTWNPEPQDFLDYSYSASPSFPSSKAEELWSPVSPMQPRALTYQNLAGNGSQTLIGLGLEGINAGDVSSGNPMNQYELNTVSLDCLMHSPGANMPPADSTLFTSPHLMSPPTFLPSTPRTPSMTQAHRRTVSRTASASPSPPTRHTRNSSHARRPHHGRSQSQYHRRKSGSKESNGQRPVSAGFVNFTPDDSRKILTGVAPSGSSKTKARREKEAAEKRRKLSEAAKKAIIEAGGDVAALEREGLLALMGAEM